MKWNGLTQKEAEARLKQYGYNEIKELIHISPLKILLRQIKKNFVVYLLLAAVLISFFVRETATAYTISVVLIAIVAIGFFQEYKAERAIKALKQMVMPVSIVIRDGKETEVQSREIVIGDVIVLRTGEKVPADCLILEERDLQADESILTGESQEIRKFAAKSEKNYERNNMIFMATNIVSGRCIAKVLHANMDTEFGKIAGMISTAEKELLLQKKVNSIAKIMVFIALLVSVITGIIMLARVPFSYSNVVDILIVVIAIAVSAFPEGFPVVLISTLANGAYRMASKNAIVNRMSIIETLGETTVICSDKTGTLTTGEMTVKNVFADGKVFDVTGAGYEAKGGFFFGGKKIDVNENAPLSLLLKASALCNDSRIERKGTDSEYNAIGTPTEVSLLIMAAKAGIFREDLKFEREEEIPFTSERKMMSILSKENKGYYVYSKGALEFLIEKCKYIQRENRLVMLTKKEKDRIIEVNKKFTSQRHRVLALAYKKTNLIKKDDFESNLVFLGIVAMLDPPREDVAEAIKLSGIAGIKVKMITGDNKETAVAIAREIGILDRGKVITGDEIDKITDHEFSRVVNEIVIFARVRPEHKLRIVKALKQNGEIVTMTGDGVNDAPALKEAHIGVAMGKTGTDVSREAADLILKDNSFSTIVYAIKEGRTIFNNIQKFISYQLSCNYAELMVIFLGILLGLPLPLLALQILFMNLVTDDLPALTLGFNPPSFDVMEAKPRRKSSILNKQLLKLLVTAGSIMALGTLGVFYFTLNVLNQDIAVARTSALLALIFLEIANAFNFRSFRYPVHRLPFFANKYLVYASIASVLATILIVYTPLSKVFELAHVSIFYWLSAFAISLIVIIVFDVWKLRMKSEGNNENSIKREY